MIPSFLNSILTNSASHSPNEWKAGGINGQNCLNLRGHQSGERDFSPNSKENTP